MENKRGSILNQVVIQIILVAIILALFLYATAGKINSRGVRQQVIEKEIALLLDSAVPGMSFGIFKTNSNGIVNEIKIEGGNVLVFVDDLTFSKGYPYFSTYKVSVSEEQNKFVVSVE